MEVLRLTSHKRNVQNTTRVSFRGSYSLLRSRLCLVWAKGYYGCEHKASAINLTREQGFGFICTSTCRRSFLDLLWLWLWSYRYSPLRLSQWIFVSIYSFQIPKAQFDLVCSKDTHLHRQTVSKCDYRLISAFPPEWQNVKIAHKGELV